MAPPPSDRARYEAAQAAFVRALRRGDRFPEGVDPAKAAAASRSLWRKRMRAVQAAWPALAIGLGERFESRFETFARAVPPPRDGFGHVDGLAFAGTLDAGELSDDARVELLLARAELKGPPYARRRGVFTGALLRRGPRRLLVVLRVPVAGRRMWVARLGRGR